MIPLRSFRASTANSDEHLDDNLYAIRTRKIDTEVRFSSCIAIRIEHFNSFKPTM